jgi:hypothetical protein
MNTVGIDFGTTKTLVYASPGNSEKPEAIPLGRSGPEVPTAIHVDAKRGLLFGEDAEDQLAMDPGGCQRRFKLALGTTRNFILNGHPFTPVELAAEFLQHIRKRVETEHFHGAINRAVITVPAKFGPAARNDLDAAVKKAGFSDYELLDEPIAAGIAFLDEKKGSALGDEILVFDWGGGTLDIGLVEFRDGKWILNHDHLDGDVNLGGEDIDDALMDATNDKLRASGQSAAEPSQGGDYAQLWRRIIDLKRLLSKKESHTLKHLTASHRLEHDWTRTEFEEQIADQLDRAMRCVANWKRKAGAKGEGAKRIVLVGGSSQIPAVSKRLELLGMNPLHWTRGTHAVALGAALKAGVLPSPVTEPTNGEEMLKRGICHYHGTDGFARDFPEAFRWFLRSAEASIPTGMRWTGLCYLNGHGVAPNLKLAHSWLKKAADAGNADAERELLYFAKNTPQSPSSKPTGSKEHAPAHSFHPLRQSIANNTNDTSLENSNDTFEKPEGQIQPWFFFIPLTRALLINLFTFGLFTSYWTYRNWEFLKRRDNLQINPRARGLFSVFFISEIIYKIKEEANHRDKLGCNSLPAILALGLIIPVYWNGILNFEIRLIFIIFHLLSFTSFLGTQILINEVNNLRNPRPRYEKWTIGQAIFFSVGIMLWLFIRSDFGQNWISDIWYEIFES